MTNTSTAPRAMQILTGLLLAGFAGAGLWIDVHNNHAYGLKTSEELAHVMVAAAVGVAAFPAIAAGFGWSALLRLVTAICLVFTCWAAVNNYAEKMGAELLSKTGKADQYTAAKKDQDLARATLDRIKETADAKTLDEMIVAAKAAADKLEKGDTAKMGSQSCFKPCREAQAAYQALIGRLAEAKARDAAKAELAKAKDEAKAGPAEASMLATLSSKWSGASADTIARIFALVEAGLAILLTQGLALFAHQSSKMIISGLRPREIETPATAQPQRPHAASNAIKAEAEALDWLIRKIRASQGRIYRGSANKIAEELGLARSTFASWMKRWVEDGKIETRRQGRETEFFLPTAPRLKAVA